MPFERRSTIFPLAVDGSEREFERSGSRDERLRCARHTTSRLYLNAGGGNQPRRTNKQHYQFAEQFLYFDAFIVHLPNDARDQCLKT